ncbi:MAG TPA: hypothetical protein VFR22_02695 [Nocardioidaceae bacterium]|nr:hypothetical protein [Nocardioidaceae bacterium]
MHVLPKLLQRPLLFAAMVVLLAAAVGGSAASGSAQQQHLRPGMTKVHAKYDGMVLPSHLCHTRAPHESLG